MKILSKKGAEEFYKKEREKASAKHKKISDLIQKEITNLENIKSTVAKQKAAVKKDFDLFSEGLQIKRDIFNKEIENLVQKKEEIEKGFADEKFSLENEKRELNETKKHIEQETNHFENLVKEKADYIKQADEIKAKTEKEREFVEEIKTELARKSERYEKALSEFITRRDSFDEIYNAKKDELREKEDILDNKEKDLLTKQQFVFDVKEKTNRKEEKYKEIEEENIALKAQMELQQQEIVRLKKV